MTRIPDLAGELVGWRAWVVAEHFYCTGFDSTASLRDQEGFRGLGTLTLHSPLHQDFVWSANTWTVADCRECPDIPGEGCSCGIYAARDCAHLFQQGYQRPGEEDRVLAVGEVGLAGKVVVCERGYRAEKGRLLRLWVPHEHWNLAATLGETYAVPVGVHNPFAAGVA